MPEPTRNHEALQSLRNIPLFANVSDADLESIASHMIERRYPRHSVVVEEGLPGDYMYVICEGRVKVTKLSEDGREKILKLLGAGDFFGEMALLDRAPRSASVETLDASRMLALARNDFLASMRSSPNLAMAVVQELTRRLREASEHASSLSFLNVRERTKDSLARLAQEGAVRGERRVTPALTHQQIADMIGTSRETVTRVIKDLKTEGWLVQEGKSYLVKVEPK